MKKIILLGLITCSLFADVKDINENLLKTKQLEKEINFNESMKIKTNLINDINFNFDLNKNYLDNDFNQNNHSFNVSFNQDIFRSGGILYSLESSDIYTKISNLNYEISIKNIIKQIVQLKYENEINNLNLSINNLNNKYLNIEKEISEEEYKAGIGSFLNITSKTISLNNNLIENSNLKNNFKIIENNFYLFSSTNVNNYILPIINEVSLNDFLNSDEINLMKEQSKYQSKLLDIEKTTYLPKISVYGNFKDDFNNETPSNNTSIGIKLSMPLKLTKNYNIEELQLKKLKSNLDLNEKIRTQNIDYLNIQKNIDNFNTNIKLLEEINQNWYKNYKDKENEYKAKIISKKQLDLFELQYQISKQNILLEQIKKNNYITLQYIDFNF